MRKLLILWGLSCVLLCCCHRGPTIVGSWVSSSSNQYGADDVKSNGGTVNNETFFDDGVWRSEMKIQFFIGESGAGMTAWRSGTWELKDGSTLNIHVSREGFSSDDGDAEKEESVSTDIERIIITLDNEHLEYMEKGKHFLLIRKE